MTKIQRRSAPTPETSSRMRRVRTRWTEPEVRVARELRLLGIAYTSKTNHLPGRPDFVAINHRVAVFVDGCFWHGCPRCYRAPLSNRRWWSSKITENRRRDRRKDVALRRLGYSTLHIWEHDSTARIRTRLATARRAPRAEVRRGTG
jgi:DNA mismatch endonuclease (patch repair protein)